MQTAMETVACFQCRETFLLLDDYSNHLMLMHPVESKSRKRILANAKFIETSNSKNNLDDVEAEIIALENSYNSRTDYSELAKETADDLFSNLRNLIDISDNTEQFEVEACDDLFPTEESVTKYFQRFRDKLDKLEVLEDRQTLQTAQYSVYEQMSDQNNTIKKTDNDKIFEKRFFCPFDGCEFWTNKKGLKDQTAAKHIYEYHKITPEDMDSSEKSFKFKRIKVQKLI